jgi:hypothetical protein
VGMRRVEEGSRERGMRRRIRRAGIVLRLANRRVTPAAAHVDGIRRRTWASAWVMNRIHGGPARESGVGAGGFGRQSARRLWRHSSGGVAGCSPRRVACSGRLRLASSERAATCELRAPGVVCRFGGRCPPHHGGGCTWRDLDDASASARDRALGRGFGPSGQ